MEQVSHTNLGVGGGAAQLVCSRYSVSNLWEEQKSNETLLFDLVKRC